MFFCSQVKSTEPLPSNICLTCTDRLLSAYQFRRQCISSYDTLKQCLTEFQNCNFSQEEQTKTGIRQQIAIFFITNRSNVNDFQEIPKWSPSNKKTANIIVTKSPQNMKPLRIGLRKNVTEVVRENIPMSSDILVIYKRNLYSYYLF